MTASRLKASLPRRCRPDAQGPVQGHVNNVMSTQGHEQPNMTQWLKQALQRLHAHRHNRDVITKRRPVRPVVARERSQAAAAVTGRRAFRSGVSEQLVRPHAVLMEP